jgi:hypothetical protein
LIPYLVALFGVLIVLFSTFGVAAPERLATMMISWSADTRVFVAVGARLVMGVLFLLAAPRCRFPTVIRVLGALALAGAVVLALFGAARVDALVEWWSRLPTIVIRIWCVLGALVGAFIVYAALPGSDPRRGELRL